ncbi:hypothetical protein C8235_16745 [Paracidovorax avenae]|nr:hypothetical protein C8235_16745 [Paracidovorax avenae]
MAREMIISSMHALPGICALILGRYFSHWTRKSVSETGGLRSMPRCIRKWWRLSASAMLAYSLLV